MNPHFHMKPEMSSLRVYSAPNGYEERRPYDGIIMVNHLTDTVVYLHGAIGKVDRGTYTMALKLLQESGVKKVMYERRGEMKTMHLAEL
jgi:hypothetical protein